MGFSEISSSPSRKGLGGWWFQTGGLNTMWLATRQCVCGGVHCASIEIKTTLCSLNPSNWVERCDAREWTLLYCTCDMTMTLAELEDTTYVCTCINFIEFNLTYVLYSMCLYNVRKFNWWRSCLAQCDEILDHFPLFDYTLRHIELCNSVISQILQNPPKLF